MAEQLQPYWADFLTSGGSEFGDYLAKRGPEVADALLSVTDARAAASNRPVIYRAYNTVRGGAAKHVQAALPSVGDLVTWCTSTRTDRFPGAAPDPVFCRTVTPRRSPEAPGPRTSCFSGQHRGDRRGRVLATSNAGFAARPPRTVWRAPRPGEP